MATPEEEIEQELVDLCDKKRKLDVSISELKKKKAKLLLKKYPVIYRISCRPSKNNHCKHDVGCFSTYEKAKSYIPAGGSSHDGDDDCTWYYAVIAEDSVESNMYELDASLPSHFPYTGW